MRILFAILVVGLLVFVFWRGWLQFNVSDNADQTETKLIVNKDKIKQDLQDLHNQERAVVARSSEQIAEKTTKGRIQTIGQDQITMLSSDGQAVQVRVLPDTSIRIRDKVGGLADLHVGDPITVVSVTRQDRLVASSISTGERPD